jgi:hypothetical protein
MASLSLPLPFCGNRLVEADFSIRFAREPFFGRGKEREREREIYWLLQQKSLLPRPNNGAADRFGLGRNRAASNKIERQFQQFLGDIQNTLYGIR